MCLEGSHPALLGWLCDPCVLCRGRLMWLAPARHDPFPQAVSDGLRKPVVRFRWMEFWGIAKLVRAILGRDLRRWVIGA